MSGMDIGEFLMARLDEDEQAARAAEAEAPSPWRARSHESDPWTVVDGIGELLVHDSGTPGEAAAAHIAQHYPARVLAEVAAKRALLLALEGDPFDALGAERAYEYLVYQHLAAPYDDHPDYDEEWRP